MRKIALRGLIGRRRDSLLLWTVVVLAFLFLALPTTLITSIEATDAAARKAAYGTWQVMAPDLPEDAAAELAGRGELAASLPMIEVSGTDYFQGDNTYYFTTYSPELAELGSFQLREGRWPQTADEVVVEYARLAALGLEVGDSFSVQCALALPMTEEHAAANRNALDQARQAQRERMTELYYHGDWEVLPEFMGYSNVLRVGEDYMTLDYSYLRNGIPLEFQEAMGFLFYWGCSYAENGAVFQDGEHPEGQAVPLGELTEEQFAQALELYLDSMYLPVYAESARARDGDLLGMEGLSVRLDFADGPGVTDPMDLKLICRYTICGVIETYTDRWDSGRADLPCGFITEESCERLLAGQRLAVEKYPLFDPVPFRRTVLLREAEGHSVLWREAEDSGELLLNRLAYPSGGEGSGELLALVMGILFVTTVCAVFQICFTQVRRRLRRVVLLKSIGAASGQIAGMMFWEFLCIWTAAAPLGTALGLLGAWAAAALLGGSQGREVLLALRPGVLAGAVLAGTLALALGMAAPAVMAVGVPLTGRTVRKKPLPPPKREVRQDFLHITLRGLAAKKGRTAGTFALCTFMMATALLSLFLGFRMLGPYRDAVLRDGRPDYLLRAPYAMSSRQREEYLAELEALGACGEVSSYFVGANVGLERSAWGDSPLFTAAAGDGETCPVALHTLLSTDPAFARLQAAATAGRLDPAAFDRGEQVLLFLPLCRDAGKTDETALSKAEGWDRLAPAGIDTTFYAEYDGVYRRDGSIQVGDPLPLEMSTTTLAGDGYAAAVRTAAPTVGAIVYFFPDRGIWPFSGGEGAQIAASPKLLSALMPSVRASLDAQAARAVSILQRALPALEGSYGYTDFYVTARADAQDPDTALLIFARSHSMDIEVYRESSQRLLRGAVNNILLVCLLGLTAVLLALVIFANTVSGDIEQERRRIGILQALGVPDRLFALRQLALGLAASALALALANGLLWAGTAAFARVTGAVLGDLLWGYPAALHVGLSLAMAALLTLLFLLPMGRLRKYLPVENIRSGK